MELRGTTGDDCKAFRFEGSISARTISKSVGQGGFNIKADVLKIQHLLNLIAPEDGGPPAIPGGQGLKEDGLIGPKTIGAIKAFQLRQQTGKDGRVDPNGPTLKRLNEVPKRALQLKNASIMAKIAAAMADLVSTAEKAKLAAQQAMDFLTFGAGLGTRKRSFELADLYFGFGKQSAEQTLGELSFIRTTYNRARTVLSRRPDSLTGGSPFGISIFTIDPIGEPFIAYSRTQTADGDRPIPEVHSGLIYVCERADTLVSDLFTHVLFHELIHFVDDEEGGRNIRDDGKYREKAMQASHLLKMRNADNYALFGTHLHIGRQRLVASQPTLGPHIPSHL